KVWLRNGKILTIEALQELHLFARRDAKRSVDPVLRDGARHVAVAVLKLREPARHAFGANPWCDALEEPEHGRAQRRDHGVVVIPFLLLGVTGAVPMLDRAGGDDPSLKRDQRVRNLERGRW